MQELEDITAQEVMKEEVAISEKTIKDETPNRLGLMDRKLRMGLIIQQSLKILKLMK